MTQLDVSSNRFTTQRARFLARSTKLREPEAKAVAYSEAGYSISGISKNIDVSQSTVQEYLERAMALYGLDICETLLPNETPTEVERVNPGYHNQLDKEDRSKWLTYVRRHKDKLPQEWVHEVIDSAKEDGYASDI